MNHKVTFIKSNGTDLALSVSGEYTCEDALDLIGMMKDIIILAEKMSVKDLTEMLNKSDEIRL